MKRDGRCAIFSISIELGNYNLQTSQLIEVVTWRSGDPTLIYSLRAHTRVITDIDWHSKMPHLLASCSIDTFTHLWDLRDPKKPMMSLSAVCMCKYSLEGRAKEILHRAVNGQGAIPPLFHKSKSIDQWRSPSHAQT